MFLKQIHKRTDFYRRHNHLNKCLSRFFSPAHFPKNFPKNVFSFQDAVCRLGLVGLLAATTTTTAMIGCLPKSTSSGGSNSSSSASNLLREPFTDHFDRVDLGDKYRKMGGTWEIRDGALHSSGEHNIPLWLDVALPTNARIEFDAWSLSPAVDTKVEVFTDGKDHASGYIVILGGWKNSITTIARLDEHEKTRVAKRLSWEVGKKYHWTVERSNGSDVVWSIDGKEVLRYTDKEPLVGDHHRFVAFSNWESDVYYDNLVVTPLPD